MSESIEAKGQCLCGAVEIATKSMNSSVGACHCTMCRKWAGGPFLAVDCKDDVTIKGGENIRLYNSSDWAERGFCSKCGTNLFYHLKQNNQYIMSAGFFNLDAELNFDHQVFIDEKPAYYCFSNDTKNMTGAEVFAQYMGGEE